MAKGKLILICQCGGEFVKNDDGSLKYNGGEAQAVNIDSETLFDDLKLKLAELCNLDLKSVVVKYFLPGNTRTLINLSSDKELKRMLGFHGKSVTAEVFVTGTVGFVREALNLDTRDTTIKVAESANRAAIPPSETLLEPPPPPAATVKSPPVKKSAAGRKKGSASQKKSTPTRKKATPIPPPPAKAKTPGRRKRKHIDTDNAARETTAAANASDDSDIDFSATPLRSLVSRNFSTPIEIDMSANPADTVKKRRRIASLNLNTNNSNTAVVTVPEKKTSKKPSKIKGRKRKIQTLAVDEEDEPDSKSEDDDGDFEATFTDDGPLGKIVSSWKKGIKRVGQDFTDAAEFRDILQKYALARRFVYKLKKNEATRVSARCVIESCTWKLIACWIPTDDVFRVKTFNKSHSCKGESWRAAHPNRRIFVNFIREKLRDSPHQKVKDIANSLSRDFGLELNISQVRRGINDAREQLQGSYHEAYNQLSFYCDQIAEANPMSFVKIETNEEKRFKRLFISFNALIHGFESGCRPLLFLEATSMKSKCKEKLLTATALDGNDGLFPIAFAIVENEENDNWRWFLEMLKSALPTTSGSLTFVFDREKGLKERVLGIFGDAHIGYSIYHLLQRFMRSVKRPFQGQGRSSLPGFLLAAAQTIKFNVFKSFIEKIMKVSPEAYDWLMQVEPEYWASTSFKGEPYNHINQNVAEPYIKLMEEKRETTITHKLEALIYMMSDLINTRRTEPANWTSKLTPPKQDKLREEFNEARGLKVLFSSDTIFEVRDEVSHVVNLNITECTCLAWQRTGIPCRHAIAVFNCTNRNIYDYCSRYYTTDSYILTYSKNINLVDRPAEIEESDPNAVVILPPQPPRPWSSQPRRKIGKILGISGNNGGNEQGQIEDFSVGNNEIAGEGNLIAAFDANGQVHDNREIEDNVNNVENLFGDCHEVAIGGDPVDSLDSVVEVVCEVVDHGVTAEINNEIMTEINNEVTTEVNDEITTEVNDEITTEVNDEVTTEVNDEVTTEVNDEVMTEINDEVTTEINEITTDVIGEDGGEGDRLEMVEGSFGISLDENSKFNVDHDIFGEANYDNIASNEIIDEATNEVSGKVSMEVDEEASLKINELNDETLGENIEAFCEDNNNNESFYEANVGPSLDAQIENDEAPKEGVE